MVPRLNRFGSFQQKFLLLGIFVFAGLIVGPLWQARPVGQPDVSARVGAHDSIRSSLWALSPADQFRAGERHQTHIDSIGAAIVGRFIKAASPVWSDRLVTSKTAAATQDVSLVAKKVRLQI